MRLPLAAFAAFLLPVTALAQPLCFTDRNAANVFLQHKNKQVLIWHGLDGDGDLQELWQGKNGRWTRVIRFAKRGQVCVVAAGFDGTQFVWHPYAVEVSYTPKKGNPS